MEGGKLKVVFFGELLLVLSVANGPGVPRLGPYKPLFLCLSALCPSIAVGDEIRPANRTKRKKRSLLALQIKGSLGCDKSMFAMVRLRFTLLAKSCFT